MGKFIKLWEGWSSDYTHEFSDLDFDLVETGNTLIGSRTGQFVMSDINDYYNELIARLDSENEVISQKSNFNLNTGNASFEIRVKNIGDAKSFFVTDRGVEKELKFISVESAYTYVNVNYLTTQLSIKCYNNELGNFLFGIYLIRNNNLCYIKFNLRNRYVGVDFSLEQYQKLKDILEGVVDDLDDANPFRLSRQNLNKILGKDNDFRFSLDRVLENKGRFVTGMGWSVDLKKIMRK